MSVSEPAPGPVSRAAANAESFLRLEEVSRRFGAAVAVDGVNLAVRRGEFFSLLGASGCGKTTLLRLIAGFEGLDSGSIMIDGQEMAEVPPHRRPVNMVFQSYALFPHLSVENNIAFGLRQDGLARMDAARRVGEMIELVQLSGLGRRKPHELSGGQAQRVALARSLAKLPKLLLLDEPLAALDRKLREEMRLELVRIQRRLDTTFVFVTHDQEEAMSISDRIAVMDRGRIVQIGPPQDVYEAPRTRFVADFIGAANIFEGNVRDADGKMLVIDSAEAGATLRAPYTPGFDPGARVWVAVRPEKMTVSPATTPATAANMIGAVVGDVSYQGGLSVHHLRISSGKTVRVSQVNPTRRPGGFPRGTTVAVTWPAASAVVLGE